MVSETDALNQKTSSPHKKKSPFLRKLRAVYVVGFLYLRMIIGTALVFLRILFKPGERSKKGGEPQ